MGLFSWLKTSEKAIDTGANLIEKAADGIGKMFFTDQEKSEAAMKAMELWLETQKTLLNESTAKSITRRYLAFAIMAFTLAMGIGACVVFPFSREVAAFILSVMKEYGFMTTSVVVFYFGYYAVQQVVGNKK